MSFEGSKSRDWRLTIGVKKGCALFCGKDTWEAYFTPGSLLFATAAVITTKASKFFQGWLTRIKCPKHVAWMQLGWSFLAIQMALRCGFKPASILSFRDLCGYSATSNTPWTFLNPVSVFKSASKSESATCFDTPLRTYTHNYMCVNICKEARVCVSLCKNVLEMGACT